MTQLLTTIRQEIERLKKYYAECGYPGMGKYEQGNKAGRLDTLDYFLSFLDTLAVESEKPVIPVDLEKEVEMWYGEYAGNSIFDWNGFARHFYELGKKDMKEQMLKDAFVDNYVVNDGRIELEGDPLPSLDPILILPYSQFKPGDKVRIVVLKAEEE